MTLFDWEKDTCLMCDLLAGELWVPFRNFFTNEEVKSELLYETPNLGVIVDVAPITDGHCLIISKTHIPSFACLLENEFDELMSLKDLMVRVLKSTYGDCIVFEHGAANFAKNAGCCIDHAHLHVVPLSADIFPIIKNDYEFNKITDYSVVRILARKKGYLFYESQQGNMYLAKADIVTQQYFRRIITKILGNTTPWNWRDHIRFGVELRTKEKLLGERKIILSELKSLDEQT